MMHMTYGVDTQSYYGLARVELSFLNEIHAAFVQSADSLKETLKKIS